MPELTRIRKILSKGTGVSEELLELSTDGLTRTLREALSIFLNANFPGARITTGREMEPKPL